MEIGDRLREERERAGYTQEQFGEMLGVKKVAQYNYERGERVPDARYLGLAADNGVDVLYVLTGERHDNVARGNIELGVLQRFRKAKETERYAVTLLLGVLIEEIPVPPGWSRF